MTTKLHPLLVSLSNAYESHDHDSFHDLLLRVNAKLLAAQPATKLANCARGAACVCTTFEQRTLCSYSPAPRGGL